MEKEEVFFCFMEKEEKVREEKEVYTLVEGGEGERERDEKSAKNHRKNHRKMTENRPKSRKIDAKTHFIFE